MAWIYIRPIGVYEGRTQQEGVCEEQSDLTAAAGTDKVSYNGSLIDFAPGSFGVCLEDSSSNFKCADGTWKAFGAESADAEEETP